MLRKNFTNGNINISTKKAHIDLKQIMCSIKHDRRMARQEESIMATEQKSKGNYFRMIFILAGSTLAYAAGSGYTTGQEAYQYFISFGKQCVLVGIFYALILGLTNIGIVYVSRKAKLNKGSDIYSVLCGKYIGKFYDIFSYIFSFMCYMAMIAGGASTLWGQYGIPRTVGAIIFAVIACATVMLGLMKMIDIIGMIGPIFAVFILIISVAIVIKYGGAIPANLSIIANHEIELVQVAPNWFMSALSIGGYTILMFALFSTELTKKYNFKSLAIGQTIGVCSYCVIDIILSFAFISRIQDVAGQEIPTLILANTLFPGLGKVCGIMICMAIFTTACPLLYAVGSRFAEEKTKKFNTILVVATIAALLIAMLFPFSVIMNFLYNTVGYVGASLIIFTVIRVICVKAAEKKDGASVEAI